MKKEKLTMQQRIFCRNYVRNGSSGTKAYMTAYDTSSRDSAKSNAWKLLQLPKIQGYIRRLEQKTENETILDTKARKMFLSGIINGETVEYNMNKDGEEFEKEADLTTKLKAVDILNKMSGEYTTKLEGTVDVNYEMSLKKVLEEENEED